MPEQAVCLDTGVWIKYLTTEEPVDLSEAASRLVLRTLRDKRMIAPAFAWAEVGSTLRKKVRQALLAAEQADALWADFSLLPIQYLDSPELRERAWRIADAFELPTLYDASFLACIEQIAASSDVEPEFWTTDRELLRSLGSPGPTWAWELTENT